MHSVYTLPCILAVCAARGVLGCVGSRSHEEEASATNLFARRRSARDDVGVASPPLGRRNPPGKDTSSVPRPRFGNVPYGTEIVHCTVPGKVALTFDDGPGPYTAELLDILKANGVRATFFLVGDSPDRGEIEDPTENWTALVKRMHADGHHIGSHTWTHADLSAVGAAQRHDEVIKNEMALIDILGFFPAYLRPPYTRCPADCMSELGALGYHVANYDIDTRDWEGDYNKARNTFSSIVSGNSAATSSWISLAHDVHDQTVHGFALYMINQARAAGYQLVTYGECLGDDRAYWYRDPVTGGPWDASKAMPSPQPILPSTTPVTSSSSVAPPTATPTASRVPPPPPPPPPPGNSSVIAPSGGNKTSNAAPAQPAAPPTSGSISTTRQRWGALSGLVGLVVAAWTLC